MKSPPLLVGHQEGGGMAEHLQSHLIALASIGMSYVTRMKDLVYNILLVYVRT
jgi:hypothetical protein